MSQEIGPATFIRYHFYRQARVSWWILYRKIKRYNRPSTTTIWLELFGIHWYTPACNQQDDMDVSDNSGLTWIYHHKTTLSRGISKDERGWTIKLWAFHLRRASLGAHPMTLKATWIGSSDFSTWTRRSSWHDMPIQLANANHEDSKKQKLAETFARGGHWTLCISE